MNLGVPQPHGSQCVDSLEASPHALSRVTRNTCRAGILLLGLLSSLLFAGNALAANASIGLGTAASFSVLAGSTVTNTGPTTMFGDLGLYAGSSVTGAPHVLGQTHIDDPVAIGAKSDLTTAYNDAASRPSNGSAGTELAGQTFLPGVRTASSSLLLSSGSVTLDAQGDPNAVFIFQIGSTLTTGSNTAVSLINGAQACNVFWQVGSSATLGTGTRFVGTIMAAESISATTAATIHGRLLAQTAAVTMDTNTITTSNCASSVTGAGGGTEAPPTAAEVTALAGAPSGPGTGPGVTSVGGTTTKPLPPVGSRTTGKHKRKKARKHHTTRRASKPRSPARPVLPHVRAPFTG
jgi:hypothetical protein